LRNLAVKVVRGMRASALESAHPVGWPSTQTWSKTSSPSHTIWKTRNRVAKKSVHSLSTISTENRKRNIPTNVEEQIVTKRLKLDTHFRNFVKKGLIFALWSHCMQANNLAVDKLAVKQIAVEIKDSLSSTPNT
jgi:hypothetical protein